MPRAEAGGLLAGLVALGATVFAAPAQAQVDVPSNRVLKPSFRCRDHEYSPLLHALNPAKGLRVLASLLVAFIVLSAGSARAQQVMTLVSNAEQTPQDDIPIHWNFHIAQPFTTGSDPFGYWLTGIDIMFDSPDNRALNAGIWTVDANNHPDERLFLLNRPSTLSGNPVTFTAPTDAAALDPATTYAVVFSRRAGFQASRPTTVLSGDEDSGSAAGWSIHDQVFDWGNGAWGIYEDNEGEVLLMAIKGKPRGFTATLDAVKSVERDNRTLLHHRFDLNLSEPVWIRHDDLAEHAFEVTNGSIVRVKRKNPTTINYQGRDRLFGDQWRLDVRPDDLNQPVTVTLKDIACGEAGSMCTQRGGGARNTPSLTMGEDGSALLTLSIADATGDEDAGQMVFRISFSRRAKEHVRLRLRTIPGGTATEGVDYRAHDNPELFIPHGQKTWDVGIPLIDDNIDDDGETVMVEISDARLYDEDNEVHGQLEITRSVATGTIRNTDPMPQAWLARFGRTVADQVLDAVAGRMAAPRDAGTRVTVAGQRLGGEADLDALEEREAEARLEALSQWFRGVGERDDEARQDGRALAGRELLTGSSFALAGGSAETGFGALWGRGAVTRFDGREGALALDGEVASAMLGADYTRGRGTLGVVLSHSRGDGGYRAPSGDGEVEAALTGVYPWGRYEVSERLTAWGVVGYGAGELVLTPGGMAPIETDMALQMAAVGGRGVLAEAPEGSGLELAAVIDALAVRTSSEEVRGRGGSLAASEAEVTRVRLGLEGTWRGLATAGGGTLVPSLALGVRHDGGDAETGFGADIGAGLRWTDRALGIEAGLDARGLLTHEDGSFSERGFAGTFAWAPVPGSELGPSLRLSQAVGAEATGGMEALLRPDSARGLGAANDDGEELGRRRFEARLGYGWPAFGGRYTAAPEVGVGLTEAGREVSHSWRLVQAKSAGLVFGVEVEAVRFESAVGDAEPEHRLVLGLGWRLEGAPEKRTAFETRLEATRGDAANDDAAHRVGISMRARW